MSHCLLIQQKLHFIPCQPLLAPHVFKCDFFFFFFHPSHPSSTLLLIVAVDKLPNFLAAPTPDNKPGPHHQCSIHINCESVDILEAAYTEAMNGRPSTRQPVSLFHQHSEMTHAKQSNQFFLCVCPSGLWSRWPSRLCWTPHWRPLAVMWCQCSHSSPPSTSRAESGLSRTERPLQIMVRSTGKKFTTQIKLVSVIYSVYIYTVYMSLNFHKLSSLTAKVWWND